jgi:TRAP-type uncharacterized transport system substrate-binding protein
VASFVLTLARPCPSWAQPKRVVTIASGAVGGVYFPIAGLLSGIASDGRDLNVRAVVASSGRKPVQSMAVSSRYFPSWCTS